MPYRPLKPLMVSATPDQTGKNNGNLTSHFATGTTGMPGMNVWEVYHFAVTGGPPLALATIILAGVAYSTVTLDGFGTNEWDPQQPMEVRGDQEIYFLWNIAAPGAAGQIPSVSMWPRYDPSLPENRGLS